MLSMDVPQSWTVTCDIYTQKVLVILSDNLLCCILQSCPGKSPLMVSTAVVWTIKNSPFQNELFAGNTQRKLSGSNVFLHSLLIFLFPSPLLFPYPLITFYIFPYFNTLVWQIVAVLVHQINLTCPKELPNQVSFHMNMPYSSKFLNILWFPIQVLHFLPFPRVFYYPHYPWL